MIKINQYSDIHGWTTFEDLYLHVYNQLPQKAHIIEIGCWKGRSAAFMATLIKQGPKDITFDCIDTWKHFHADVEKAGGSLVGEFTSNIEQLGLLSNINILQLDSLKAHKLYDDDTIDFIFLDTDHLYLQTLQEISHWVPKLKSGGLMGFDDYFNPDFPGVAKAVQEQLTINTNIETYKAFPTSYLIKKL